MTRRVDSPAWTRQQQTAIGHRGTDVYVAASAGTGKTAVLTGRCVEILSDRTVCPSALNVLVVTFTEAAAEEMRTRIRRHLEQRISAEPGHRHLVNQLLLLPAADISTIHAFCKRLITERFYELGLDGGFRVIDADEQSLLKARALDQTLVWAWDQPDLEPGLEALFARRSVDRFASKILDVSDFLDGLVDRRAWYEQTLEQAERTDPFRTEAGLRQQEGVVETLRRLSRQVRWLQGQWHKRVAKAGFPGQTLAEGIEGWIDLAQARQWDRLAHEIRSLGRPTKPKADEADLTDALRQRIFHASSEIVGLAGLAVLNPDYRQILWPTVQLQVGTFMILARRFDETYRLFKTQIHGLDFADLEHEALRLLTDGGEGTTLPSPTALVLRKRYQFLFVDEYQDINPVQQAILDRLRSPGHVFGVGDVKQSIYAFRGAEPMIFLDCLRPTSTGLAQEGQGLRVDLTVNFRSNPGILDFVNALFGRIMTEPCAGLDYDETARLIPPSASDTPADPAVELHVLDELEDRYPSHDDEGPALRRVSDRERQAALIAQRIQQMVGTATGRAEFQIRDPDTGAWRDVRYRDIVVLFRSPSGRVQEYERILRRAGVPVMASSVGFFESIEVQDCLNLLKVLDNPHRDIEIAAVLRSPIFGVTDTDLAKIRTFFRGSSRRKSFYEAFRTYTQGGPDKVLADRLRAVHERLQSWRQRARVSPLAEVIWQVFSQTGLLSFVSALPDGTTRRANLLKLHERAIQFDRFRTSQGFVSLGRFVEFVETLQDMGGEWGAADSQAFEQEAVRIISIHKSKGLEFPVVILAELNAEFNRRGFSEDVLSDTHYRLGLQVVDSRSGVKIQSLEHQVIAEQISKRDRAEEMRILYVATTRARERLILTGALSHKRCRDTLLQGLLSADQDMVAACIGQFKNALQWILYGCADQTDLQEAFQVHPAGPRSDRHLLTVKVYGPSEIQGLSIEAQGLRGMTRQEPMSLLDERSETIHQWMEALHQGLSWRYPFQPSCTCPAKKTVSDWVREAQTVEGRPSRTRADWTHQKETDLSPKPRRIDAGRIGTGTHLVLSCIPLERPITQEVIGETIHRLIQEGILSESIAGQIDREGIVQFFLSPLGKEIVERKNQVFREWPFTLRVSAEEVIGPGAGTEPVVVQGVADLVLVTPTGAVIIDFKTDRSSQDRRQSKEVLYQRQLAIYAKAVESILGITVKTQRIYYLAEDRTLSEGTIST